ncbi:MAG: hypothetical protein AUG11_03890 [Nitrospirae bacterium 13_1_20CM_2_62_14]|nr:MAG: hypothetical protein AUH74_02890 [Nitrospirae bacterium 13_1_40CM_4_62_6]OLD37857.1 MAG: hypothetical protein AUI21_08150 [Nitrospirae bacterium 13_1_40CM_2_62_10]OLE41549.1 MAG: hypothetical protein AUG11_03890 [Nitrospirae bacterium 13_1_20CM_2_62_14]
MRLTRLAALVMMVSVVGLAMPAQAADKRAKAYSRFCKPSDLVGTWRLVKFSTPHEFKDPHAPYLLPHQMFQFLKDGTMKSAHSAIPLPDDPTKVFQAIASESTYSFVKAGQVTMKAKGPEAGEETWHCVTITEDRKIEARQVFMKRGDLVMTLIGMNGEPAFTRQLRKGGA